MLEVLWEDFSSYIYFEKKLDKSNDSSYRSMFNACIKFFEKYTFDKQNVNRFFAHLQAQNLSNSTLNNYLKTLKNIAHCKGETFLDHYTYFKEQYAPHRLLTVDEVKRILNSYIEKGYNKDSKKINYRFYASFHLMCVTGCRLGEVCNLKWSEVFPHFIQVNSVTNKTNESRTVPIRQETFDILSKLEKYEHGYVFGDYRGKMSQIWFNKEFKYRAEYVKVRDPKSVHSHQLRYFAAVSWRKAGVEIDIVSKLLGHRSIETTVKFYQDYPTERMEDAIALSPLFADKIPFSLIKRKIIEVASFIQTTAYPLHMENKGNIIILQTQDDK